MIQRSESLLSKIHSVNNIKTILYLRTDICFEETKVGGSITHTVGVIKAFHERGYRIICASYNMISVLETLPLIKLKRLINPPIFAFLRGKFYHVRWRLECFFSNIFFTLQTLMFFKQQTIGFIYQRYSLLNCTGVILRKIMEIPLVLEYNGSEVWIFEQWAEKRWFQLAWLSRFIEKINLKYADYIVVVSHTLKKDLVARGIDAQKIIVNFNGVDPLVFDPQKLEEQRMRIRDRLDIKDKFVFGFIGTFSYWHGIEVLAQVIPAVLKQYHKVHFLLIGDGLLKNYLAQELHRHVIGLEQVTLTGFVSLDEAKHYLAACDAFLCPTQPNNDRTPFFGSPTKIFEYMSLGKPIVASNIGQLTEVLSPFLSVSDIDQGIDIQNHIGILVDPLDIKGFVKALMFILKCEKEALVKIGCNTRSRAMNYSWDNHIKRIEACMFSHNIL